MACCPRLISMTPSLTGSDALISLAGYFIAYLIMFPAGIVIMTRLIRRGFVDAPTGEGPIESGRPDLPVRALRGHPRGLRREPLVLDFVLVRTFILGPGVFFMSCSMASISASVSSKTFN